MELLAFPLLCLLLWAGHTVGTTTGHPGIYGWSAFGLWIMVLAITHVPL